MLNFVQYLHHIELLLKNGIEWHFLCTSDFVEGTSARQNKRKTGFPFVLFSLIRTFALTNKTPYYIR